MDVKKDRTTPVYKHVYISTCVTVSVYGIMGEWEAMGAAMRSTEAPSQQTTYFCLF